MQPGLPFYIAPVFFLAVGLAGWFFYRASPRSGSVLLGLLVLGICQLGLAASGFYEDTSTVPPRFLLAVLPSFALLGYGLFSGRGKQYSRSLDVRWLTALSVVRVPVELVLLWLYQAGQVPQLMTFEGWNFDILAGLTAPLVAWLGFAPSRLPRWVVLGWHLLALGLLLVIVTLAVLSLPGPLQRLGLEQPNRAVLTAPFILLPALVVPIVLFSHLIVIQALWAAKPTIKSAFQKV
jgi:hypothetical protein